jgi:hypothetical protein
MAAQKKWTGVDFTFKAGDAIYLKLSGSSGFEWTIVGNDASQYFEWNVNSPDMSNIQWISIPYTNVYTKASQIVVDIEGSLAGSASNEKNKFIKTVALWVPGAQTASSSYFYQPSLHKWMGVDFQIKAGDGVYIGLSGVNASLDWTPPLIIDLTQADSS